MSRYVEYTIKDGDTLASISQRVLGDVTKATQVALYNDLNYPFIGRLNDSNRQPGVLYPGDILRLFTEVSNSVKNSTEIVDCDILLSDPSTNLSAYNGGDFEVDLYGDLQSIEGDSCLRQDLMDRLKTEKGTLLGHPTYGSGVLKFIGTKLTPATIQDISVELTKTFLCDPRVKEVASLNISEITGGIHFTCVITTDSTQILLNESLIKS